MAIKCNPYHSVDGDVYHIYRDCTVGNNMGNNIERDKQRSGMGGLPLCQVCKDIRAGKRMR